MSELPTYDLFLLFNVEQDDDQRQHVLDELTNMVETSDGTLVGLHDWGKRQLAYPIEKEEEAHYTLLQLQSKPDFVSELQAKLKITDGLLRYRVFRLDEDAPPPPDPSKPSEVEVHTDDSEDED